MWYFPVTHIRVPHTSVVAEVLLEACGQVLDLLVELCCEGREIVAIPAGRVDGIQGSF